MTFGYLQRVGFRMFLGVDPVFSLLPVSRLLFYVWLSFEFILADSFLYPTFDSPLLGITLHHPQSPRFIFFSNNSVSPLFNFVLFLYYPVSLKSEVSASARAAFPLKNANSPSVTSKLAYIYCNMFTNNVLESYFIH